VHGGHVTADLDPATGAANWVKAIEQIERPLPMLIENTAGGNGAMARTLEAIARLWEGISAAADGASGAGNGEVGFCLDTCHANSAGIELADAVDRVKAITGRIDLVHCNNSRDEFGSGADRHANFDSGTIDAQALLDVVRSAGAPVVCETPEAGLAADIAWLQARTGR
jgi:deoxyribonuclease-4